VWAHSRTRGQIWWAVTEGNPTFRNHGSQWNRNNLKALPHWYKLPAAKISQVHSSIKFTQYSDEEMKLNWRTQHIYVNNEQCHTVLISWWQDYTRKQQKLPRLFQLPAWPMQAVHKQQMVANILQVMSAY